MNSAVRSLRVLRIVLVTILSVAAGVLTPPAASATEIEVKVRSDGKSVGIGLGDLGPHEAAHEATIDVTSLDESYVVADSEATGEGYGIWNKVNNHTHAGAGLLFRDAVQITGTLTTLPGGTGGGGGSGGGSTPPLEFEGKTAVVEIEIEDLDPQNKVGGPGNSPGTSPGLYLPAGAPKEFILTLTGDFQQFPLGELRIYATGDIEISQTAEGAALSDANTEQGHHIQNHTVGAWAFYIRGSGAACGGTGMLRAVFRPDPDPEIGGGGEAIDRVQVTDTGPLFDAPDVVLWLDEDLKNGDVIGTIAANSPCGDPVTYTPLIDLEELGLELVGIVLPDGRNAVELHVVEWLPMYFELIDDVHWSFELEADNGSCTSSLRIRFDFDEDEFFGTSKKPGSGAPPAGWYAGITTLPPAGDARVILANRGKHSFVILLDSAGNAKAFSGFPEGSLFGPKTLTADSGDYGVYEGWNATTEFQLIGTLDYATADASMTATVAAIVGAGNSYDVKTNNCHCTSYALLRRAGYADTALPATTDTSGMIGTALGWKKMPDGVLP